APEYACLDEHDVAAHGCVVHARCDADLVFSACALRVHPSTTEERLHIVRIDAHPVDVLDCDAPCRLARDLAQLTLELADARLARVLADHAAQCLVGDLELRLLQAVLLALPRQ